MQIFALFMFCGIFTSLLIPETKRKTLEELSGEVHPRPRPQLTGVQDIARNEDAEKGNVNVNANLNTVDGSRNPSGNESVLTRVEAA